MERKGKFESTEQLVCDQARAIRKNGEQDITIDAETKETDVGTVEEETNDAKDNIGDSERNLSQEHQVTEM